MIRSPRSIRAAASRASASSVNRRRSCRSCLGEISASHSNCARSEVGYSGSIENLAHEPRTREAIGARRVTCSYVARSSTFVLKAL